MKSSSREEVTFSTNERVLLIQLFDIKDFTMKLKQSHLVFIFAYGIFTFLFLASSVPPSKTELLNSKPEKIIGADISFLPQLEEQGVKFSVDGKQGDAIQILKD